MRRAGIWQGRGPDSLCPHLHVCPHHPVDREPEDPLQPGHCRLGLGAEAAVHATAVIAVHLKVPVGGRTSQFLEITES